MELWQKKERKKKNYGEKYTHSDQNNGCANQN